MVYQLTTLTQQIYDHIKRKIVTLEFPPGSVINEADLGAELKTGRTPIREALQRLERDKLVVILPRRGTFVTDVNIADLPLLYDGRVVLEKYITRLAATRGTVKQWDEMEEVLTKIVAKAEEATLEELVEADRKCHEIIFTAANHKFLNDTLVMLYAQSDRLWHVYSLDIKIMHRAISEHQAILAALRKRDSDQAALLIEEHIQTFRSEIQTIMMEELFQSS